MRFDCAVESELEAGLEAAQAAIEGGELVVLPTDTVYGLAADAFSPEAVQRLLDAKGRTRQMPPPVLVGAPTTLESLAVDLPSWLRSMTTSLWPGPLTVVCHQQPSLMWDLGETHQTVAVRMPDDPVALALLKLTGPLAVVTILAGASRQPRSLFLLMVFVGRTAQFLAIAYLVHGVT